MSSPPSRPAAPRVADAQRKELDPLAGLPALAWLPPELPGGVLTYLGPEDWARAAGGDRAWRTVARSPSVAREVAQNN